MVESIGESLRFMEALSGRVMADIGRVDFFTSHEGLHLYYEQAMEMALVLARSMSRKSK